MKNERPLKGQCRPRVCTFEIPASVEASWRAGDKTALADALVGEIRQLGRQVAEDYDVQSGKGRAEITRRGRQWFTWRRWSLRQSVRAWFATRKWQRGEWVMPGTDPNPGFSLVDKAIQ